jgi:phage terminase large subunit
MKATTSFKKILKLKHKNKIIQGSQGAGKTYSILMRWILMALNSKEVQYCSIITATFPALRDGAIKDFQVICDTLGIDYDRTKTPYVFVIGKWKFNFFSVDKENKGLGARRDRLFINEANRLSWKIARQTISRTHVEVICDFNPAAYFWAHQQFVDAKDCDFIKLTYKDNELLPQAEIDSIEKHAPWGSVPDENFWRVYGMGEIGFVEGQIFKGYFKFDTLPEGDYQTAIGLDFGVNDPTAAVKIWCNHKKKELYWKEMFYASNDRLDYLIETIKEHEDFEKDYIVADHELMEISDLRRAGLKAIAANKRGGIMARIRAIKNYKLFIYSGSTNLVNEMDNYQYQQDKNGNIIDYPDQKCDEHAIDAAGYGSIHMITRGK